MDESPHRTDIAAANAEIDHLRTIVNGLTEQNDAFREEIKEYAERLRESRQGVPFSRLLALVFADSGFLPAFTVCVLGFMVAVTIVLYRAFRFYAP